MHLHHELQRALADTKIGAGAPPVPTQPKNQPHASTGPRFGRSRRAPQFRVPLFAGRWHRAR
jgi:hypothetical protein